MSTASIVSLSITVVLAIAGYLAKYVNDVRIDQRRARLDRIGRQLRELYGPLLGLSYAGRVAWAAASTDIRPAGPGFGEQPLAEEEAKTFRLWMTAVLQPMNLQLVDLILQKSDLLIGDEMPGVLLEVCANALAFEAVLKRWELGDYSHTWSFRSFPGDELHSYATSSFTSLKHDQAALIGELKS